MTSSENPRKSTPRRGRRYIRRLGTRQKQIGLSVTSYELYIRSARFIPSYEQKRHHSSSISCLHRLGALRTDGAPTPLRRNFMTEGRLHRHDVFRTQFKKRVSSPIQKHETYRRRRGKVGCCIAWKGVGAYTFLPTAWLREEES